MYKKVGATMFGSNHDWFLDQEKKSLKSNDYLEPVKIAGGIYKKIYIKM